jgi:hypothetical protein
MDVKKAVIACSFAEFVSEVMSCRICLKSYVSKVMSQKLWYFIDKKKIELTITSIKRNGIAKLYKLQNQKFWADHKIK